MPRPVIVLALVAGCLCAAAIGQDRTRPDPFAPFAIVVGDGPRAEALDTIVRDAGMRRRRIASADCTPTALRLADLVVIDWPDAAELGDSLPLGELDRWDRPTVFIGTSGERFARSWGLPGPGEMERMPADGLGPEMQRRLPPDGAATVVWRQGHLFHFACDVSPVDFASAERAWFQFVIREAMTFVTDRPILRHAPANGVPLPAAERERRQRIDATAALLQRNVTQRDGLAALPELLTGDRKVEAETLLQDLVVDGPGPETSRNNWRNWLKPRSDRLVWDGLSYLWRIDPLAHARGVPTLLLRGGVRADGGPRDPGAVALATKVAQHYGGRAFDDLTTFTCWQGDICYLWDRRGGWFRMENHGVLPAGARAVQWDLAVLDTAADRDVIWGGGPAPQPKVSARYAFRNLIVNAFLPAMLLEPGTSLHLRPDADSAEQRALLEPGQFVAELHHVANDC